MARSTSLNAIVPFMFNEAESPRFETAFRVCIGCNTVSCALALVYAIFLKRANIHKRHQIDTGEISGESSLLRSVDVYLFRGGLTLYDWLIYNGTSVPMNNTLKHQLVWSTLCNWQVLFSPPPSLFISFMLQKTAVPRTDGDGLRQMGRVLIGTRSDSCSAVVVAADGRYGA